MSGFEWRQVPIGLYPRRWVAQQDHRRVLVIVHSICAGRRLLDAVRLLEPDWRLEIVFTAAPDVSSIGVAQFLADIGGIVVPWQHARQLEFELALSGSYYAVGKVHAPLIVMPREVNSLPSVPGAEWAVGDDVGRRIGPRNLSREGNVPTAIVLPHDADWERLARACPEALPAAAVIGDPSHDRLVASLPLRAFYRRALGVSRGQKLVLVTSTRGPRSLFGATRDDLIPLLLTQLPPQEYRVLGLFPPMVWSACGAGRMYAGMAGPLLDGLSLMPPDGDWRAALAAADWIVGDGDPIGLYGTVPGVPVVLTDVPDRVVDPSSALAELVKVAPRLSRRRGLPAQLSKIMSEHDPDRYQRVTERITSAPGRFNRNMRRLMYRILGLPQPATIPVTDPVSPPFLCDQP